MYQLQCSDCDIVRDGHVQTHAELQPLRNVGDADADAVLAILDPAPHDDVLDLLLGAERPTNSKEIDCVEKKVLRTFLDTYSSAPAWVDWEKIRKGQDVFVRDLPICGLTLFYLSLIGGFSAPLITKVLRATGYLTAGPRRVLRRLADTGHMICECLEEDALNPTKHGAGWKAVMRVRFLHGMVRRRLAGKPYWQADLWGTAINQEDMCATLLAFSYNVIVGIEMVYGRPLSHEDQDAYIHLWRYIGWLIGIEDMHNPCIDLDHSKAALESIVMHLLEPDDDSRAVAHHLLLAPGRGAFGQQFRHILCRRFLGDELADALSIHRHGGFDCLVTLFLWTMRAYTYCLRVKILAGPLMRLHRWALARALTRGRDISSHQLHAEPPGEFTSTMLQGRCLSADALPSPKPSAACPFLSLSEFLVNHNRDSATGGGDGDTEAKAHVTDTASKTTLRPTDSERQSVYSPISVVAMVAAVAAFTFWLHG